MNVEKGKRKDVTHDDAIKLEIGNTFRYFSYETMKFDSAEEKPVIKIT